MTGAFNRFSTSKLQRRDPCECTRPNGLEWSHVPSEWHLDHYDLFVERLRQVTRAWQLLPSFPPFFSFLNKKKKATIFDVLKRYSLVKWTMALQRRVLEAVNSQMKQPFTNIWNLKKKEGFICSWSVWNVLLWLAADRLANSDASYQTVLEHLSVQARQTTDKPSSHLAASLDSVKLHQSKLYSLASLASFILKPPKLLA